MDCNSDEQGARIDFQAQRRGEVMARSLTAVVAVVFLLNLIFLPLDWWAFPELVPIFFGARGGLFLTLAVVFFFTRSTHPMASAIVSVLAMGAMLLTMSWADGGVTSKYSTGLVLLFCGIPVLLPFSTRETAGVVAPLLGVYALLPVVGETSVPALDYALHAFFPLAGAVVAVGSAALLDRIRFSDFLKRRELEQARDHLEEMDRTKSRFTANIHHELRTPLTLTLAPIEGMLAGEFGDISELQRQYMKTAEVNAIRLLKLINNLLDLAKLESKQLELQRVSFDPVRLVEDLVDGARPMAERKGIALVAHCAPDLPLLHADPEALEKILVNLLGNALKFTGDGGRIDVGLAPGGEQGGVRLQVADSGIGIPPEQLERIFDRFAQVDASSTRKHEGTGIGLSLCHELVELHAGRIWAESDGLGRGTRMCVWLPTGEAGSEADECVMQTDDGRTLAAGRSFEALEAEMDLENREADGYRLADMERNVQRHESTSEADPQPDDIDGPGSSAAEILVADDNTDMRRLLQHLLGREFRVRLARNGREALESVRERAPDVVLTDVMMPEMSGTDLCRALKESPETRGIPVILLTSKAERSVKIEGLELGADDYVTKPFHARELLARVRSLTRVRQLQADLEEQNQRLEAANLRLGTALGELKVTQVQLVRHERLAAIGELAAGVAHEANNPLNFAANAVRSLMRSLGDVEDVVQEIVGIESWDPSEARGRFEKLRRLCVERDFDGSAELLHELGGIIEEGLERTSRIVGDLRDFARPGAVREETVDLRAAIQSTLQLMNFSLRDAGIGVELSAVSDFPLLYGDARALNQVFLNLLKNASDAMADRGGTIRIELAEESGYVVVRIRDEGPGVPDEMRQAIFEPFCTTKSAGKGSGLGLSISRSILHEHGGSLDILESSERGTTFELRLPLPEDD